MDYWTIGIAILAWRRKQLSLGRFLLSRKLGGINLSVAAPMEFLMVGFAFYFLGSLEIRLGLAGLE